MIPDDTHSILFFGTNERIWLQRVDTSFIGPGSTEKGRTSEQRTTLQPIWCYPSRGNKVPSDYTHSILPATLYKLQPSYDGFFHACWIHGALSCSLLSFWIPIRMRQGAKRQYKPFVRKC